MNSEPDFSSDSDYSEFSNEILASVNVSMNVNNLLE